MKSDKNTKNKQKSTNTLLVIAYELGFRLLIWIAAPIIVALFVGKWLDSTYQTSGPVFFSCFIGLAFIVSSVGIVKESVRSMKYIDQMDKTNDSDSDINTECADKIEKK